MRYIETWLTGLGLDYIIPKLKAQGITTPKKLAALSLRDIYEVGKALFLHYYHCINETRLIFNFICFVF